MTPLYGTLAFAQAYNVAVLVSQYLELDMAWPLHVLFHVEVAIAESSGSLGPCLRKSRRQFFFPAHAPHSTSATPGRRFHNHRVFHLTGPLDGFARGGQNPFR